MQNFVELSIDRTSLSQAPLFVASDLSTDLVLTSYTEPGISRDIHFAPTSPFIHGEVALGWRYATTGLAFTVGAADPDSEQDARAALAELSDALARLSYSRPDLPRPPRPPPRLAGQHPRLPHPVLRSTS